MIKAKHYKKESGRLSRFFFYIIFSLDALE